MTEEKVARKRRPDFVTLIAVYRFVVAGIYFLVACALGIALIAVLATAYDKDAVIGALVLALVLLVITFIMAANVAVGWGLMAMQNWARWLAIVMGLFSLLSFPIGTIVGAFSIWYLLTDEAKEAFGATS